jgi:hydrophobe/amphiphile efflux-3 (HAE3) family protein
MFMTLKEAIVKFRWPALVLSALVTVFMCWELSKLSFDANMKNMMPATMASRINTDKIEAIFGSSDMLMYIFQTDDVLNKDTLARMDKITADFKKIPGIKKVISLSNSKEIKGQDGSMVVTPAVAKIPGNAAETEKLRKALEGNEMVYGTVVSKDFKAAAIIASLKTGADPNKVLPAAQKVLDENPGKEIVTYGGQPAFERRIQQDATTDISRLIPASLLIMLFILFSYFRTARSVILPFTVVICSMIFGMGLLPVIGWKISILTAIMPLMIVAYSNNYGIYLMSRYRELHLHHGHTDKLAITGMILQELAAPIFFTGLITIAGILGLLTHVMVPARQVGVTASLAIGFAVLLSLSIIPAILSMIPLPAAAGEKHIHTWIWLDRILGWLSGYIYRNSKKIIWASVLIAVLALTGAFFIKVDANQDKLFGDKHPLTITTNLIDRFFGGSQSIAVVFEGDIKDPEILKSMEEDKQELLKMPGVGQVMSIADVLKIMSRALNDRTDPGYDKIPETRDAVAQYLELYSMSGDPDDFESLVDFNYTKAQFMVRITDKSSAVINNITKRIHEMAAKDPHITMVGGYATIFTELSNTLISGQITSILAALVVIMLLVILMFGSGTAGLLSSVPLILSLLMGFGIMGVFGIRLDIATAIISSIVMGTGVDFTVQLLWRYRDIRRQGVDMQEAIKETLTGTGKAVAFNAICVVSGFGAMIFSSMPPMQHLAILFGVLTLTCMFGTLVVIPALCVVWRPKFLEPVDKNTSRKKEA